MVRKNLPDKRKLGALNPAGTQTVFCFTQQE